MLQSTASPLAAYSIDHALLRSNITHIINLGYPVKQEPLSAANGKTKQLALMDIHSKHKGLLMLTRAVSVTAASHVITQELCNLLSSSNSIAKQASCSSSGNWEMWPTFMEEVTLSGKCQKIPKQQCLPTNTSCLSPSNA